jgi:hypothetical protein
MIPITIVGTKKSKLAKTIVRHSTLDRNRNPVDAARGEIISILGPHTFRRNDPIIPIGGMTPRQKKKMFPAMISACEVTTQAENIMQKSQPAIRHPAPRVIINHSLSRLSGASLMPSVI